MKVKILSNFNLGFVFELHFHTYIILYEIIIIPLVLGTGKTVKGNFIFYSPCYKSMVKIK